MYTKGFLMGAAVGLMFLLIGGTMLKNKLAFRSKAVLADGVVIDMDRDSKGLKAPVVSYFSQDGQQHTHYSTAYSRPPSYEIGEKVAIYYDPTQPDEAQIKDRMFLEMGITALGTLVLLLILYSYFQQISKRKSNLLLAQTGQKIEAEIVSVDHNTAFHLNGQSPFIIVCQWFQNNTVYTFKSENIWFNPTRHLEQRKYLDVFIDPNNPKKHFVDISFLPKMA